MQRSGIAHLPLHGGTVPRWLADRMTRLGTAIAEHVVLDYGPAGFLSRLSDPFWFQALGCVLHDVRPSDVDLRRLGAVLAVAYEREFRDFASLLLLEKLGPRTLQSLALVAEVVHGTPVRFSDPARFSFAHGGKDGHPFPVPLKTYDETLGLLRRSLQAAKLGDFDKAEGLRRLDKLVRSLEKSNNPAANFDQVIKQEKSISASIGGRTVLDDQPVSSQLKLF